MRGWGGGGGGLAICDVTPAIIKIFQRITRYFNFDLFKKLNFIDDNLSPAKINVIDPTKGNLS